MVNTSIMCTFYNACHVHQTLMLLCFQCCVINCITSEWVSNRIMVSLRYHVKPVCCIVFRCTVIPLHNECIWKLNKSSPKSEKYTSKTISHFVLCVHIPSTLLLFLLILVFLPLSKWIITSLLSLAS